MRTKGLSTLREIIRTDQAGEFDGWYRELDGQREGIEIGIKGVKLRELIEHTIAFGDQVIQAESSVRDQLHNAVQRLVAVSEEKSARPSSTPGA
ncbi:MAG: hypothetical protein ACHRXM_28460 [Isosphaerales bacterium]